LTIKADKKYDIFPYVLMDGVSLVGRIDRGKIHEHILTPLGRIANAIHDEDQYD
jgi:hypothetical protein